MKIETTTVQKTMISELDRLDPIALYLEDLGPGQGKVIITCYDKSWTAYWGSMGDRTLAEFILSCNNDYLIGKLSPQLKDEVNDLKALIIAAKKEIIKNRRNKNLSWDTARDWFDAVELYAGDELLENRTLMTNVFGDEYWHSIPKMSNPDYEYLSRILDAVKAALK